MPNIGPGELILILIIAIVFIGPGRLPDVGAALGKSIREFRKASTDVAEATRIDTSPLPPSASATPAPTPEPSVPTPTASTVPAPIAAPPDHAPAAAPPEPAADDEAKNQPA
jgi:sec-independent protein translocase protein TatA